MKPHRRRALKAWLWTILGAALTAIHLSIMVTFGANALSMVGLFLALLSLAFGIALLASP